MCEMERRIDDMETRMGRFEKKLKRMEELIMDLLDELRARNAPVFAPIPESSDSPSTHASAVPESSGIAMPRARRYMRANRYRMELQRERERSRSQSLATSQGNGQSSGVRGTWVPRHHDNGVYVPD